MLNSVANTIMFIIEEIIFNVSLGTSGLLQVLWILPWLVGGLGSYCSTLFRIWAEGSMSAQKQKSLVRCTEGLFSFLSSFLLWFDNQLQSCLDFLCVYLVDRSYHEVQYSSLCIKKIVSSCWSPISNAFPTSCICALLRIAGFDTVFV